MQIPTHLGSALLGVLGILLASLSTSFGQPAFTKQPTNQSVSLGATAKFQVLATSSHPPILYQWRFANTNVPTATNNSLTLTNIQMRNAGDYSALATDGSGSVTSRVTHLEVDPTFTKITAGPVATDRGNSTGGTWGDFNNDGYVDLFVFNGDYSGTTFNPLLYRNNGDGAFSKVTSGPPVNVSADSFSACWGDYDNDGNLDLYVPAIGRNLLYHNNGNGAFTRITTGSEVTDAADTRGASWVDYDNDGLLDLLVTTFDLSGDAQNFLYRNNGDGTFSSITNSILVTETMSSLGCVWGDYDNDGKVDLFVSGGTGHSGVVPRPNRLYRNNGDGSFTKVTTGSIATDLGYSGPCAWGDYDNDGFLDLFVANLNIGETENFLYHNNRDGTFTRITNGIVVTNVGAGHACIWGDYDNDGFLDLFVANRDIYGTDPATVNFLYRNNGDGTFTRITSGSPVNDYSNSWGCSWADYDNDGFLDLFSARGDRLGNFLFRNNGNSNSWLTVKLIGTVSNRSAIGAKVRVKATIGGVTRWQLRQITGGSGVFGYNELRANFGLGDATNVDLLRIEWPSGIVQELHNQLVKQLLTVTEPPRLSSATATNGEFEFLLKGGRGFQYGLEVSPNLVDWSPLATLSVTNLAGTATFTDGATRGFPGRFYRAVGP